ncbi:MAG: hypothetical protein DRP78_06435 [Candidatus Omnitrophota bacterium]|nr:MAG: hypothetical protein DRP78_06435 [Candidatus Omnitrophota bacterium]
MRILKWLFPGMKVKRWIVLNAVSLCIIVLGTIKAVAEFSANAFPVFGVLILILGIFLLIFSVKKMLKSFFTILNPRYEEKKLVEIVYKKRKLSRGQKIVVIGGGTGLSMLLQGLKAYTSNLTAIVTVADDGGSSGRLRKQFNILPPGDIRNCLVALAEAEPLMQQLFQFRFQKGTELAGHNFGNLFITVMTELMGSFDEAIKESSKVLAISGRVIPMTLKKVSLMAEHTNGKKTYGETNISNSKVPINSIHLVPENCLPTNDALVAIAEAEAIVLGPGSLYTSILPNLMVKNIPEAIMASQAVKIYVCNVMTQAGETDNYTAYQHLKTIKEHVNCKIIDYCLLNNGTIPENYLKKYKEENAYPVIADIERIEAIGITVIADNLISTTDYVRHNSEKIASLIMELLSTLKNKGINFIS